MEQIVMEAIEDYNEYLAKLPNGCEVIANLFREDQVAVGLENIDNFAEGVIWLLEVTQLLKQNDVSVNLSIEKAQEFLVEINEAIEIGDYNLVADLFEYELAEFFKEVTPVAFT